MKNEAKLWELQVAHCLFALCKLDITVSYCNTIIITDLYVHSHTHVVDIEYPNASFYVLNDHLTIHLTCPNGVWFRGVPP